MSEPFVVNVADAPAQSYPGAGVFAAFEDPKDPFPDFGINIHVLQPGEANAKYHAEHVQEDFLVLGGTCTLILNGEERLLRQWDFFHCPAGTEHAFVGAGDGPCWILMVGARGPRAGAHFPVNETAAKVRSLGARVDRRLEGGLFGLVERGRIGAAALAAGLGRRPRYVPMGSSKPEVVDAPDAGPEALSDLADRLSL
jgi:quercetin dioxygenase-like cupin family protein